MLGTGASVATDRPRDLIARLAAAVSIADGRTNEVQLQAVDRLWAARQGLAGR